MISGNLLILFSDDSLKKLGFRFTFCDTEVCYVPNSLCYAYAALVRALFLRGSLHSLSLSFSLSFSPSLSLSLSLSLSQRLWKDHQPGRRREKKKAVISLGKFLVYEKQEVSSTQHHLITVIQIYALSPLYFYKAFIIRNHTLLIHR